MKNLNAEIIKLEISGMTCNHCASSIEQQFVGKKGIIDKSVSYPKKEGVFTYNNNLISKDKIIETINNTGHYKVVKEINNGESSGKKFDLIIIGGGSGAFSAAIKANELGLSTLMVNAGLRLGGTCVNIGCVPSKFLIRAGETAYHSEHSNFSGIKPNGADINFTELIKEKKNLVDTLQKKKYLDVVSDFKNLKIITGWAEFLDKKTILVNGKDKYTAEKIIIATGARTNIPNIEGIEEIDYLTNKTLFDIEEKPLSLTIMGAGYIGLEIAMAYNRLGVKVRIIEFTDRAIRKETEDISWEIQKYMSDEGIEFLPNYRVVKFEKSGTDTILYSKTPENTIAKLIEPGRVVIATGTKPNTDKLVLERIGLKLTVNGNIEVNEELETNIPNIFAIGDCNNTPAYVYTAAYEGKIAIENVFLNKRQKTDYSYLPWVIFTDPQIAGVGLDELQAQKNNIPFEVSKISLSDVPRNIAANDTRGFIKLIRNSETDKLIGARIIAPEGGELAMQLSMAIHYGIPVSELATMMYPYLTLSEGIKLAAITFGKDVSKLSCCAS